MPVDDKSPEDLAASAVSANEAGVAQALREHAEVLSRSQSAPTAGRLAAPTAERLIALTAGRLATLSPEDTRDLLHELQVHQIELQMQNEELRRSQVELDASRARYFNLYDLAPVGYCSVSEHGLILQANLAAASLLGVTRATLVKQPITRFICKADQDTWYLHRKLLAQSGQAQSMELRLARQDDSQVWVQVATSAPNDDAGSPMVLVVLTDVSNLKLMEAALRDSEERYRALVEWSPQAMLVHQDGQVIFANPAAVKIMGARTAAKLTGKPFLDLIHPVSHSAALAGLNRSDPGGTAPLVALRCLRLDGTVMEVEAQSVATSYAEQQVTITCLHVVSARPPAHGVA